MKYLFIFLILLTSCATSKDYDSKKFYLPILYKYTQEDKALPEVSKETRLFSLETWWDAEKKAEDKSLKELSNGQ